MYFLWRQLRRKRCNAQLHIALIWILQAMHWACTTGSGITEACTEKAQGKLNGLDVPHVHTHVHADAYEACPTRTKDLSGAER